MTTRTMGDSTDAASIPATVQVAAGYWDGTYEWTTAEWGRFPAATYGLVKIDVSGAHADTADVLDVERGDATPATANLWLQSWRKLGRKGLPVLYVNRSNMAAVEAACLAGGSRLGIDYGVWLATLDGSKLSGPGIVACQFAGHGTWDESVVFDDAIWQPAAPAQPKVTLAQAVAAMAVVSDYLEGR